MTDIATGTTTDSTITQQADASAASGCCDATALSSCCEPSAKSACCGAPAEELTQAPRSCGCS